MTGMDATAALTGSGARRARRCLIAPAVVPSGGARAAINAKALTAAEIRTTARRCRTASPLFDRALPADHPARNQAFLLTRKVILLILLPCSAIGNWKISKASAARRWPGLPGSAAGLCLRPAATYAPRGKKAHNELPTRRSILVHPDSARAVTTTTLLLRKSTNLEACFAQGWQGPGDPRINGG